MSNPIMIPTEVKESEFSSIFSIEVARLLSDEQTVYFVITTESQHYAFKTSADSVIGRALLLTLKNREVSANSNKPVNIDRLKEMLTGLSAQTAVEIHTNYVLRVEPFTGLDAIEEALAKLVQSGEIQSKVSVHAGVLPEAVYYVDG